MDAGHGRERSTRMAPYTLHVLVSGPGRIPETETRGGIHVLYIAAVSGMAVTARLLSSLSRWDLSDRKNPHAVHSSLRSGGGEVLLNVLGYQLTY